MPIEMPRGLPFSVDTWTPASKRKRHHFLTHAHKDHAQGIAAHASFPIYSTIFTKALTLKYYPLVDESVFVGIEIGQSLVVEDPDGNFTVSAFDANHCPGAVMFLFEGNFGNILHTGDCRLTPECLQNLPEKYVGKKVKEPHCPLDYIFLDCTFGQFPSEMPSQQTAIRQIINCIWKHPDSPTVYLSCDLLGQEEILVQVSKTFGDRIYVDEAKKSETFKALLLTVPEILSQDPMSRFQLFDGFSGLYEKAEAKIADAHAKCQHEPLIIRPSAQWYACGEDISNTKIQKKERFDQAVRDIYGVWHVCFSIHSSRDELEWALQLLAPKWVVSTTPSCRAMELSYVKKHCQRTFDDSLLKILDIGAVESVDADVSERSLSCSHSAERMLNSCVETQSDPLVISTRKRKRLSMSPPGKRSVCTLFGRARLGLQYSTFQHEHREIASMSFDSVETASRKAEEISFQKEETIKLKIDELSNSNGMAGFAESICIAAAMETESDKPVAISPLGIEEVVRVKLEERLGSKRKAGFEESKSNFADIEMETPKAKRAAISPIGFSSCNENLRKFYRSVNVAIPQPLPSLVKLLNAKKYAKKRV